MYGHESLVHWTWSWIRPNKQADNRERMVGQVRAISNWLISKRKGETQFCHEIVFLFQGRQGSVFRKPRCCIRCALEQGYEGVKLKQCMVHILQQIYEKFKNQTHKLHRPDM